MLKKFGKIVWFILLVIQRNFFLLFFIGTMTMIFILKIYYPTEWEAIIHFYESLSSLDKRIILFCLGSPLLLMLLFDDIVHYRKSRR